MNATGESLVRAVQLGSNVIDSAINYRFQRSERTIQETLKDLAEAGFRRDELIISTKAGFMSFDHQPPSNPGEYFVKPYLDTGLLEADDIAAGSHSIAPRYLENQLNRSLENLGLETIDIYYVHNPEIQLEEVTAETFSRRLRTAFEFLESAVDSGKIRAYGTATWNAYREAPDAQAFLSFADVVRCAEEVAGGPGHHFRVIQLPYNLVMREAFAFRNQPIGDRSVSTLEAAEALGVTVMASASMFQAKLSRNIPESIRSHFPNLSTDGQRAIQFVRSTPGVTSSLVGMGRPEHVEENLRLVEIPTAPSDRIQSLIHAA